MARKPAAVAGSAQEPAVADTALSAESQKELTTETAPAATVITANPVEVLPEPQVAASPAPAVELAQVVLEVSAVVAAQFPREVKIVNETPMPHIIATNFIGPGDTVAVAVRSQDEITRMETDCAHLMELSPTFAELDPQPLRVVDAAAE